MEYTWKENTRMKIDPNLAGAELDAIHKRYGEVTPKLVLERAISEDNPLHVGFEWDDAKAANLHRIDTARRIIRFLVTESDQEQQEPVFVHVTDGNRKYYEKTSIAIQQPDIWKKVMVEEKDRLQSIEKRLSSLLTIENSKKRLDTTVDMIKAVKTAQAVKIA
jgi:hypothetical protein